VRPEVFLLAGEAAAESGETPGLDLQVVLEAGAGVTGAQEAIMREAGVDAEVMKTAAIAGMKCPLQPKE